jgi:hypothetical protein
MFPNSQFLNCKEKLDAGPSSFFFKHLFSSRLPVITPKLNAIQIDEWTYFSIETVLAYISGNLYTLCFHLSFKLIAWYQYS